ncbi:MAG: FAD-dependent thymidylate synthase, partial [Ghiorsea sp.]
EYSARTCYDSRGKAKEGSAAKLVKACMNKGHYSITEHASASFHIEGVSRSLLAQITRHRQLSFCVRSQRYCKEGDFKFVTPPIPSRAGKSREQEDLFNDAMTNARFVYEALLYSGMKAEDARAVLPNACATEMVVTANFRAWYEFLSKRTDRAAQSEIRELAMLLQGMLQKECPAIFGEYDDN